MAASTKRPSSSAAVGSDPHNLQRFVSKQNEDHTRALKELQNGRKAGCWSWWIFPTPPFIRDGRRVGSGLNLVYEIKDDAEGLAYLAHPSLRTNYLEIVGAMSSSLEAGVTPTRLLGIDVPRAMSSVRYFLKLSTMGDGDETVGDACRLAIGLLGGEAPPKTSRKADKAAEEEAAAEPPSPMKKSKTADAAASADPAAEAAEAESAGAPPPPSTVTRVIEGIGPHRFVGSVVAGFKRGSKQLGWPTANLDPAAFEQQLDSATEGVYVGWARINDPSLPVEARAVHKAVLSIGWNPQFDDVKERTLEAYICHDFGDRDFYGQPMKLIVCAYLRPQAKFDDFNALIEAITTDVAFGKEALDTPALQALRHDAFFAEDA